MADPSREEEQVTLLGEEGLMAGGQALKLGYATLTLTALLCALTSLSRECSTYLQYLPFLFEVSRFSFLQSANLTIMIKVSLCGGDVEVKAYQRAILFLQRLYCDADTGVYRSPLRQADSNAGL